MVSTNMEERTCAAFANMEMEVLRCIAVNSNVSTMMRLLASVTVVFTRRQYYMSLTKIIGLAGMVGSPIKDPMDAKYISGQASVYSNA